MKRKKKINLRHGLTLHQRETLEQHTTLGIVSSAMLETIQNTGKRQNHWPLVAALYMRPTEEKCPIWLLPHHPALIPP